MVCYSDCNSHSPAKLCGFAPIYAKINAEGTHLVTILGEIAMNEAERAQLAQRLSAMSLKDARKEIRRLDPDADMVFWRNSVWDEVHTLWLLPNAGLSITLVEKANRNRGNRAIGGGPNGLKAEKVDYRYVEARVEPLKRPVRERATII